MKDKRKEKFTPGPWKFVRVQEDIDTFAIRTEDDDTLAAVGISPVGWKPGKDIANAALIAAAPMLYYALQELCKDAGFAIADDIVPDYLRSIVEQSIQYGERALKKARGENED